MCHPVCAASFKAGIQPSVMEPEDMFWTLNGGVLFAVQVSTAYALTIRAYKPWCAEHRTDLRA